MTKISIIIALHDAEKYIKDAIDDLLNQSFSDFEIICVDDGSTDSSLQILKKFQKSDRRIQIIHQDNQGAGAARNVGLAAARGKYLLFLDSDDRFEPDMLEAMFTVAEDKSTDVVICDIEYFDSETDRVLRNDKSLDRSCLPDKDVFNYKDIPNDIFTFTYNVAWNKFYRADFIKRHNLKFQELPRVNDAYFVCMSLALADRISVLNRMLVRYRTNNKDATTGKIRRNKAPRCAINSLSEIQKSLLNIGLYGEIWKSFANHAIWALVLDLSYLKGDNYQIIYNEIKYNYLEKFDILRLEEKDYKNKNFYKNIQYIQNHSSDDYILYDAQIKIDRTNSILVFYEQYIQLDAIGITVKDVLEASGFDYFILYGYGLIGKVICNKLVNDDVILFVADQKLTGMKSVDGFNVAELHSLSKYDAPIIITPFHYADEIKEMLADLNVAKNRIFSLKEIYDCYYRKLGCV